MRIFKTLLTATLATACTPVQDEAASESLPQGPSATLTSYEASEWEPSWSLRLSGGHLIAFRQLDPDTGADFITDTYIVSEQTELPTGWTIRGAGEKGPLTFTALDVSAQGGCSHSATGDIHRDQVSVTTPERVWRGCGGPTL